MCTDKHCGTENKYRNIEDYSNHLLHVVLSAKWKIAKV